MGTLLSLMGGNQGKPGQDDFLQWLASGPKKPPTTGNSFFSWLASGPTRGKNTNYAVPIPPTAPQGAPMNMGRRVEAPDPSLEAPTPGSAVPTFPQPIATGYDPVDHSSREGFIQSIAPFARVAEYLTGIPYNIMVAINLNEQGWQNPAPGNNYFGLKGRNPYTGASTGPVGTWEDYGNGPVQTVAEFRAYDSPKESYEDFANFLKTNPRYGPALEILNATGDGEAFIRAVHQAGYATDPQWSDKIISIAGEISDKYNPGF